MKYESSAARDTSSPLSLQYTCEGGRVGGWEGGKLGGCEVCNGVSVFEHAFEGL